MWNLSTTSRSHAWLQTRLPYFISQHHSDRNVTLTIRMHDVIRACDAVTLQKYGFHEWPWCNLSTSLTNKDDELTAKPDNKLESGRSKRISDRNVCWKAKKVDDYRPSQPRCGVKNHFKDAINYTRSRQREARSFTEPVETTLSTAQRHDDTERPADELRSHRRKTATLSRWEICGLYHTRVWDYKFLCCRQACSLRLVKNNRLSDD